MPTCVLATSQWGGFDLTGDWRFRHSTNLLRETGDYTRDYRLGVNAYADLPGGIQLRSDVDYSFRNGTNITPGEDDQVVWNALPFLAFPQTEEGGTVILLGGHP